MSIVIPNVTPVTQIVANGSEQEFFFDFPVFQRSDLDVFINDARQSSGYVVRGIDDPDGGSVRFDLPPTSGARVTLRRQQVYALDPVDSDRADRTVAALQELAEAVSRAVKLPVTSNAAASPNLTLPAPEAGKVLGWNASASALENMSASGSDALLKAQNLADLDNKTTARVNLSVYSTAQTDTAIAAGDAAVTAAALQKAANLSDLADKGTARTNLSVYSTAQTDAAIAAGGAAVTAAALQKAANLADLADKGTARTNLELGNAAVRNVGVAGGVEAYDPNIARLNLAQGWSKPQRPQASFTASTGGTVTLDLGEYQDFSLTLTAALTLANPTLSGAMVGQRGSIRISPAGFVLAGLGAAWKRIGGSDVPTLPDTGIGRLDYHIVSATRIEYAYNDVEA